MGGAVLPLLPSIPSWCARRQLDRGAASPLFYPMTPSDRQYKCPFYRISELSGDVPLDVGFLCDGVAILRDTIKGTLSTNASYSQDTAFTFRFGSHPFDLGQNGFILSKHNNSVQSSAPQYGYLFLSVLDHLQASIFQQKVQNIGLKMVQEGTETCSNARVLLIVCYHCVQTE